MVQFYYTSKQAIKLCTTANSLCVKRQLTLSGFNVANAAKAVGNYIQPLTCLAYTFSSVL